ncbi:MAG: nucleotidyltransferase family protein [Myxococcota bacterium]|nr:nucleotidyltransferase family protein [Myxococcota bacterium]
MSRFTGLVLAGSRGEGDALAAAEAVRHRALIEVLGVPMLVRVLRTLRASEPVGRLVVSIDDPSAAEAVPEIAEQVARGELVLHQSLSSPSRSVLDVIDRLADGGPLLVTTADHALLSVPVLDHFLAASDTSGADLAVGLVSRTVLEERFPGAPRTYLPFRDDAYSGANLFAFRTPEARRAAEFWMRAETFRKRPWRLVSSFGPVALALFLLRRLDLDGALERASRSIGARVRAVRLPFAEAAVDVDRPEDLELVTRLLAEQGEGV